jgi:hypothetical protein
MKGSGRAEPMINPGNNSSQFNRHEALREIGPPAGLAFASDAGGLSGAARDAATTTNAFDHNAAGFWPNVAWPAVSLASLPWIRRTGRCRRHSSGNDRAIRSPIRISGTSALLATLWIGAGGLPALANQGTTEERRACTPDVLRLCAEFVPDRNRITVCLQDKVRDLSPACRIVIDGSVRR